MNSFPRFTKRTDLLIESNKELLEFFACCGILYSYVIYFQPWLHVRESYPMPIPVHSVPFVFIPVPFKAVTVHDMSFTGVICNWRSGKSFGLHPAHLVVWGDLVLVQVCQVDAPLSTLFDPKGSMLVWSFLSFLGQQLLILKSHGLLHIFEAKAVARRRLNGQARGCR